MTQVAGTTLCRKVPGGIPKCGVLSFPGIEQIIYVSQDSTYAGVADGTIQKPFTTIAAAVAAANALTPAEANRILILVYPGIYSEQVTLADDYVYLAGVDRDSCALFNNTGTPLTVSADVTAVWDMKIESDAGQGIVDITGSADFYECLFRGDDTAGEQVSINTTGTVLFKDCEFNEDDDGNVILGVGGAAATVTLEGCQMVGSCTLADGDVLLHDSRFFSTDGTATVQAQTGLDSLSIRGCEVYTESSGDAISIQSQTDLLLLGNVLQTLAGDYSVQAAAAVTGAVIEDNVMIGGGIHANVSHVKPERIVGASGMCDWYATTQEALDSCTFDDIVVRLKRDETLAANLTPPAGRVLTLDGCGKHTLTIPAGINIFLNVCGANTYRDLHIHGTGGLVAYIGSAAEQTFVDCEITSTSFYSVARVSIIDCRFTASAIEASLGALTFTSNALVEATLKRSYFKGPPGAAYVFYWRAGGAGAVGAIRIQDCAIMHGSLGANNPFGRDAAQTPNYRSTHSIYNSDPQLGGWATNLVAAAQRFDSYDPNGDY